ncbi:MAG: cupin [Anaerocolumna sp.]|jgi:uncharacterized cupin superfamily protein|nr:cupin [Anaerocolumna sp.]
MEQKIRIVRKEQITPTHKSEHEPYEYYKYEITKRTDDFQTYSNIYELPPRKANYPYHYHLKTEEVYYIISGEGTLETPDKTIPISTGDVIVCPANESGAHRIMNTSLTEKLVYFECDTNHSPDISFYPNSQKFGVMVNGKPTLVYKNNTNVDYYENE